MIILMPFGLNPSFLMDSTIMGPEVGIPVLSRMPLGRDEQPRAQALGPDEIQWPNDFDRVRWLVPFPRFPCERQKQVVVPGRHYRADDGM